PAPALLKRWKKYLVRYYQRHGNTLTRAGWPRVCQRTEPVSRATVVSLGAAVVRRDWLIQAPYDEVLDPHGIGDNYGVAIQFPDPQPFHILSNLAVKHHHSQANRLEDTRAFYRRGLALHHFLRLHRGPATRLWYGGSLVGLGIRMTLSRNRLGIRAVAKLLASWAMGQNPYASAAKKGQKRVVPSL
ncbi:MAG: hypothetical protein AAFQ98_23125, partial [Bacteroidota bacterium]